MVNQKLQSSDQTQLGIPEEWKEKFVIKRIEEKDIEITLEEQRAILVALNQGQKYIQLGKYTLMLNSIKSIDPVYEPDNIPPKPKEKTDGKLVNNIWVEHVTNQDEIDLWERLFGEKKNV